MFGIYFCLLFLVVSTTGEYLQLHDESDVEDNGFTDFPADLTLPEFGVVMNQRSYAYLTAALIIAMFAAVVYCHVVSVRKSRLLEQYAQQGTLPEWSPLLIDRKNIRPPPPYEQVV